MGLIEPTFGGDAIKRQVEAFNARLEQAAVFYLSYLGEQLAKYAKDNHTYTDRTGNLTNSIGYAILKKKEIVQFSGEGSVTEAEALKAVKQMAASVEHSFSLVVVAGMNYAAYVEAKGYNVILPAELMALSEFPKVMLKLKSKAQAKAKELFGI